MACDIAENARRRKWEYDNQVNAICQQQFGFVLDGTMAKEWWVESQVAQPDPKWQFLEDGAVLTESFSLDPEAAAIQWPSVIVTEGIRIEFKGFNTPQEPEGTPHTIRLTMIIFNNQLLPEPVEISEDSVVKTLPIPNNSQLPFSIFTTRSPIPGQPGTAVGPISAWPLRRCHDCVSQVP